DEGCSILLRRINSDLKSDGRTLWKSSWLQSALAAVAVGLLAVILLRNPHASSAPAVSVDGREDTDGYVFHQDIHNALFWSDDTQTTTLVGQLSQTAVPS